MDEGAAAGNSDSNSNHGYAEAGTSAKIDGGNPIRKAAFLGSHFTNNGRWLDESRAGRVDNWNMSDDGSFAHEWCGGHGRGESSQYKTDVQLHDFWCLISNI